MEGDGVGCDGRGRNTVRWYIQMEYHKGLFKGITARSWYSKHFYDTLDTSDSESLGAADHRWPASILRAVPGGPKLHS